MLDIFYNSLINRESLNDLFDNVYVITLPKRVSYIKQTFKQMGINYIQFDAITKDTIGDSIDGLKKNKILSQYHKLKHNNEIFCYLSHISIVKKFYDNAKNPDDTCFIFEDDIVLDTDYLPKVKKVMEMIPDDWEFINFGTCWNNCGKNIKINEYVAIAQRPLCGHSYAITKKGAEKLLRYAYPIVEPWDIYFVSLMGAPNPLKLYISTPRIFNQLKSITDLKSTLSGSNSNDVLTSSLGNDDSCLECGKNDNAEVPLFKYPI
jgi:GR25 family glycosyltransferase involved in LPS biosynthesis